MNHSDGSTQTECIPLFDSHQRYLNFGEAGRNPAALVPMVLEQDKESRHLMEVCFRSSMEAGVVEYSTKGTDVICIDAKCQFCEKGIQMELLKKETPGFGKMLLHPAVRTKFPSTWDLSAHKKAVACKKSFCLTCNCNLAEHSYMDFLSKDGLRLEALHG